MTRRFSDPSDLNASHPRPSLRPAAAQPSSTPSSPFTPWEGQAGGKTSAQAMSEANTAWNPRPASAPITDPALLKQHAWQDHLPTPPDESSGFTDADALLRQMGLPPLKKPQSTPSVDKPFVEPLPASAAEFSPPRPTRREPVRFAHIPKDDSTDA